MFFNSQNYLIFFTIVFVLYWSLRSQSARIWLLLAASFTFYAFWSQQLALLVAGTTLMDYLLARGMDSARSQRVRRLLLGTSLMVNLGLLVYFKYANFFIDALKESLRAAGGTSGIPYLEVIIPFGISFYTFEAISYAIDVYKRRIAAERSLPRFMLFILFFPHLVAGPIVRAGDFLRQAARPKRFSWLRFQLGVEYFLFGLFKKMAIADNMAVYSDPIFADGADLATMSTTTVWVGVFAFAIRIFCDFSGYTDMALGSAHMLGYKLTINFRMPYLSRNIAEFWRRWHISLSSWLRDYLFIPLGGSRGGHLLVARNLMITMTLGGLWHGANWSFIVWGVLHGSLLVIHRLFRAFCEPRTRLTALLDTWVGQLLRMMLTFMAVTLCWVFFQPSLARSLAVFDRLATPLAYSRTDAMTMFIYMAFLFALGHLIGSWSRYRELLARMPSPVVGGAYAVLLIASLLLAPAASKTFIYFQF